MSRFAGLLITLAGVGSFAAGGNARSDHTPQAKGFQVLDVPDIIGHGKVLDVGRVHMKVTNLGLVGNPFTDLSSDPSGQWPDDSGVEYLNAITLAVGAVDATTADPARRRRVSYFTEWRPPSLEPADRIYPTYQGATNGVRFVNDDGDYDPVLGELKVDEDRLDGRDNDGDGLIDEDFDARGWQEFSCVMRDDTQEAMANDSTHLPLGLECQQLAWAYGVPGFLDFNVVEYTVTNVSGHVLDSLYVGWRVDMDAGPISSPTLFLDDRDLPGYPSGEFTMVVGAGPGQFPDVVRRQFPHNPAVQDVSPDSALCPRVKLRINGFALADDDGDSGATPGVASILLVHHTVDPSGETAPRRVGLRAFRSFQSGTPYAIGGNPSNDAERYEFMSSTENIDPVSGFITAAPGASQADYLQWCSIGPFRNVPAGGGVTATIVFAVQNGSHAVASEYAADYQAYLAGTMTPGALFAKHPMLLLARNVQIGYEGVHESREGMPVPDFHGRETAMLLPIGSLPVVVTEECAGRESRQVIVTDQQRSWFDFDCDYCTGVWDHATSRGLFHHTWKALPPPAAVEAEPWVPGGVATPNPARTSAALHLVLDADAVVSARAYDVSGRLVRMLAGSWLPRGEHWIEWDLRDDAGARVAPGLYFVKVATGGRLKTSRIAVVE